MTPEPGQLPLPAPRCARCGREALTLAELAHLADCAGVLADRARDGLRAMKLALPTRVTNALDELATRIAPRVAQGLSCAAGVCFPPAAGIPAERPERVGP